MASVLHQSNERYSYFYCSFLVLILFSLSVQSFITSEYSQWEHFYLNQMNLTSSYDILINTSLKSTSSPSCVYDNLIVEWNTSLHPTSIHFAFTIDNEWDGYSIPLSSSMLLQSSNSTLPLNPLKCDLNEDHCVLNVVQVYLSEKKLSIEFDKPTNQVDLMSTSKLNVLSCCNDLIYV